MIISSRKRTRDWRYSSTRWEYTHWARGWVGPRAGRCKEEISWPYQKLSHGCPVLTPSLSCKRSEQCCLFQSSLQRWLEVYS